MGKREFEDATPFLLDSRSNDLRLNLGAGSAPIDGYENGFDRKNGKSAFPLDLADNTCSEIRASHLFEHFSHRQGLDVLREWVRCLKPGGLLKLAVPDFEFIAAGYLNGIEDNWQGYLCGGHIDVNDIHLAQYDEPALSQLMRDAGLVGIHKWKGNDGDCSSLPVSLNLAGWKPLLNWPSVHAVMSVPRLGFMDNFFCVTELVAKLRCPVRKFTGAYWGQCITRSIEEAIQQDAEYILTIDYDSVFHVDTVLSLLATAIAYPQVDALVPIQMSRRGKTPLMTVIGENGEVLSGADRSVLEQTILPIKTGHFGLTLLRTEKFARMSRPWFVGVPDNDGRWGDGRIDDDIHFWNVWRDAGNTVYAAPRCVIGHTEVQVIWPDVNLQPMFQHVSDFWAGGEPRNTWR